MKPANIGLPSKFQDWYPYQLDAVLSLANFKGQALIQTVPTGVGKSIIYLAGTRLRGGRTIVLTSTKGLQDQLMNDFWSIGLVEVRGKMNYPCMRGDGPTAEDGLCNYGIPCELQAWGCPYHDAIRLANRANLVVTNYAFWLHNERLEPATNLVMDEAHSSPDHLSSYLTAEVGYPEVSYAIGCDVNPPQDVPSWVNCYYPIINTEIDKLLQTKENIFKLKKLHQIKWKLERVKRALNVDHVINLGNQGFKIEPIEVDIYTSLLTRGAAFVLLTSATVTEYHARMLGLKDAVPEEYPSPFPVRSRPIEVVPTIAVDRKTSKEAQRTWKIRIEQIIGKRLDRKGIIHTVSYERAEALKQSKLADLMVFPHRKNTRNKVLEFKGKEAPAILVSPAVSTGFDFPYDQCEYQIIAKVPFPEQGNPALIRRCEKEPEYSFHLTWQELIQACGRGMRASDDRCQNIIIDDHFFWFMRRYKHLAPKWFLSAVKICKTLPAPLPKL